MLFNFTSFNSGAKMGCQEGPLKSLALGCQMPPGPYVDLDEKSGAKILVVV
jgi:hypothetical protein